MGKNTMDRQEFIINNLRVELDLIEENAAVAEAVAAAGK
jgi:topoisomerase-4 subunit B